MVPTEILIYSWRSFSWYHDGLVSNSALSKGPSFRVLSLRSLPVFKYDSYCYVGMDFYLSISHVLLCVNGAAVFKKVQMVMAYNRMGYMHRNKSLRNAVEIIQSEKDGMAVL